MEISLTWWNTSLSPPRKKSRASSDEIEVAVTLINFMLTTLNVDLLALGEISDNDINTFNERCDLSSHSLYSGVVPVGRSSFGTCVFYRREKLNVISSKEIVSTKGSRKFKVAQRLDVGVQGETSLFYVFLSHWPSRLNHSTSAADRLRLGMDLRSAIDDVKTGPATPKVILLGDYNDEPFDPAITDGLLATRDRKKVLDRPSMIYNPFWRHLGSASLYAPGVKSPESSGSCYYYSDENSSWKTFDQIMFSAAFLGLSAWHLKENLTSIVCIPEYLAHVKNRKLSFDHLPIFSVIEKVVQNG